MFKLVVLSCLVSVAFAGHLAHPVAYAQVKTIVEPQYSVVETPTVQHVGSVVKSIPTAHSYQSQTQYHSKSVVEPIYAHGVEKHVVSSPIVKQYVQPAVKYVQAPIAYEPAVKYVSAPAISYAHAAPAVKYVSAPAHYASAYSAYPSAHYEAAYPSAYSAYSAYPSQYAHHY